MKSDTLLHITRAALLLLTRTLTTRSYCCSACTIRPPRANAADRGSAFAPGDACEDVRQAGAEDGEGEDEAPRVLACLRKWWCVL